MFVDQIAQYFEAKAQYQVILDRLGDWLAALAKRAACLYPIPTSTKLNESTHSTKIGYRHALPRSRVGSASQSPSRARFSNASDTCTAI